MVPESAECQPAPAVLYVHGATFPSALSVAFPFDGHSWMDRLSRDGFDAWAFDFLGFGDSNRYPAMSESPGAASPLGRAADAARQIADVISFILQRQGAKTLSIIAHSWGTIATCLYASDKQAPVERLALFGPIVRRQGGSEPPRVPAYRDVTLAYQADRFQSEVPSGQAPVFAPAHWAVWSEAYLDTDQDSRTRTPPAVRVPTGPLADILAAHTGTLAYDPADLRAPALVVRGEWDTLCTAADAAWLWDAAVNVPWKRSVQLDRGTHVMHLEENRFALYSAVSAFLREERADEEGFHGSRR